MKVAALSGQTTQVLGATPRTAVRICETARQSGLRFEPMLDRIRVDPRVCEGKPTIRGMRITVDFVLKLLGDGYTADDIVREYPELEKEDVYQAATYGAWLAS